MDPPGPQDGTLSLADGRVLAWRRSGPPNAPPALFLHGSTGSRRSLPPLPGVRILAYDRPGYGGSTPHPGRDLRSDAKDLAALLVALDLSAATVLAFSGGAATGYALAALDPARARRLVVVSGATWPAGPPPPEDVLRTAAEGLRADPAAAVAALADGAPAADRRALALPAVAEALRNGADDAVAGGIDGWVHEARLIRSPWPFAPADVQTPVRLWHGREDEAVPLDDATAVARELTGASLRVLDGAGHLGWLAHLDALADELTGRNSDRHR